jgi:hypothetical protein
MSFSYFVNPPRGLGELAKQRRFFWRTFALTVALFLCL